jgi:hypothetical protein
MGRIGGLLGLCFIVVMTGFNVAALSWLAPLGLVLLVATSFFGAIRAQEFVESAIALGLDEYGMVDSGHREALPQPGGRPRGSPHLVRMGEGHRHRSNRPSHRAS